MVSEFDGVNILVHYTSEVIGALLKDIPQVPAVLEEPYVTRGDVSSRLHVPFEFDSDASIKHGVDPIYDSMKGKIILSSSMNYRFLSLYNVQENSDLAGHKVMIRTESLKDTALGENRVLFYSLSRSINDVLGYVDDGRKIPSILNPEESTVELLYRNVEVFPACIIFIPSPRMRPGSTDYALYFHFHDTIKTAFAGKEYHISINLQAMNKLMNMFDVDEPDQCMGKDIAVYVHQEYHRRKLWICGMTSYEQYLTRSTKFEDFKNTR